ncbi:hypothetical protein OG352_05390 [Streptomyces sp. NBC_01485]|uniref:hypothetical protein n=1 Tax=Streptomyces sp. NBC_01485 TaxID=2903884 RepID=UPI002E2EF393|nr:hypothetical protein [Streptomyces sp. NBC_01485]
MTETAVTPYPEAPAEIAAAVLDRIEANQAAFNMYYWAHLPESRQLDPDAEPACGTTLCAAGWVAHLTGWTLVHLPEDQDEEVIGRDADGREYSSYTNVFAEKGDHRRFIGDVARDALRLADTETFWDAPAEKALSRLRAIAGR